VGGNRGIDLPPEASAVLGTDSPSGPLPRSGPARTTGAAGQPWLPW